MKISIIGLGFVGDSMLKSFNIKNNCNYVVYGYDKYKNGGIGNIKDCVDSDIIFLALPTEYNHVLGEYDKRPIYSVLDELRTHNYNKCVVIKSTIEPKTTEKIQEEFYEMNIVHNPEFLTARTAFEDFHNQQHIVFGKSKKCSNESILQLCEFYGNLYPNAEISICESVESESMKIFCNSFYAVKIQFFNELYLLSKKINGNYDTIVKLMLKNNWINPMHTNVPGPDGNLSYGGLCFPKDTNALLQCMIKHDSNHNVLKSCIEERNEMRKDNDNIKFNIDQSQKSTMMINDNE
jgi:UDPglucose 6-dehydrogenase